MACSPFAGGDMENGRSLALGILLQNLPADLAVATSLLVIGYGRVRAYWVAFLTGLVEPVGGLLGSVLITLAEPLVSWTLEFAAGAMIFVISDEVIPETHRGNHQHLVTFSLMAGVVVMLILDALTA